MTMEGKNNEGKATSPLTNLLSSLQDDKELMLRLLEKMQTIRAFEERLIDLFAQGFMPGLAHLCIGQEAVAVGVCDVLEPGDFIVSNHRGHGHLIARGAEPKLMMAEIFGRSTGYCKGKAGSMHIAVPEIGILGATGIVGGGIPLGTGAGLACKLSTGNSVAVVFFGDGAVNQGTFHESLNIASLWRLPVLFICENNQYAISAQSQRFISGGDIVARSSGYDIPGVCIDGNDVMAVREAASRALSRSREGGGPSLIECRTYRWRGHHEGDPGQGRKYRKQEEMDQWKKKCPIELYRKLLNERGLQGEEEWDELKKRILNLINKAEDFAKQSPFPAKNDALLDVYADSTSDEGA